MTNKMTIPVYIPATVKGLIVLNIELILSTKLSVIKVLYVEPQSYVKELQERYFVEMGVGIGVVPCWVCEIVILFFLFMGSIVSFRAFGS